MIRRHGGMLRALLMLTDGALAVAMSLALYQGLAHPDTSLGPFLDAFWARALVYGLAWVGLLYINGAYRLRAHWTLASEARSVVRATFWLSLLGISVLWLSAADRAASGWVLLLFPLQGVLAIIIRAAVRSTFMYMRRQGYNVRNLLIVGTGTEATDFGQLVREHSILGVQVVGYLGDATPAGVRRASIGARSPTCPGSSMTEWWTRWRSVSVTINGRTSSHSPSWRTSRGS